MSTHSTKGQGLLEGRAALVTGGGRGIGRAVCLSLAREGASVAVCARSVNEIEDVAAECRQMGTASIPVPLNITDRDNCAAAVQRVMEEWGTLDILVNNAGMATAQKFSDLTDDVWRRTLEVDLTGAFHMTQAALPTMLGRRNGRVIAIGSIAGKVGAPYIAAYNAAKHGLLGLMRSLAAEYAQSGVTFNTVCPAYVDTPMTEGAVEHIMRTTGRTRDAALELLFTPQGRLVRPEEVAAVCVLLASEAGAGITGQSINVDGGTIQW